jgi:hypothetical protein
VHVLFQFVKLLLINLFSNWYSSSLIWLKVFRYFGHARELDVSDALLLDSTSDGWTFNSSFGGLQKGAFIPTHIGVHSLRGNYIILVSLVV